MPVSLPSGLFHFTGEELFKRYRRQCHVRRRIKTNKGPTSEPASHKLDQIELERADGVTMEDVQSSLIEVGGGSTTGRKGTGTGHPDGRQKYPSITVLGEATHVANAPSRRKELTHRISIWITDREVSPDSELAQIKLCRYVEAVERILSSDPTLGGKAVNSAVTDHRYRSVEEVFMRKAVVTMQVYERPSTNSY